jgi:hypothetical protein
MADLHAQNESQKLREYQASMGRLIGALEWAWKAIQSRHPELPDVVLTVASGGRHRKLGHFSPRRWEVLDEGERPEVLIGAEGLKRFATDVLGTLLHEAAHGLAHVRGIRDTSRRGHYHNGRYRELAMELGLEVIEHESAGWSLTSVPIGTTVEYAATLEDLTKAMQLYRHPERPVPKGRNFVPADCGCGRRIRVAKTELRPSLPAIVCEGCGEPFRQADALPEEE